MLSTQDLLAHAPFIQRGTLRPAFVEPDQAHVIEAEQPQNGGVKIVNVQSIFYRMQAKLIGCSHGASSL